MLHKEKPHMNDNILLIEIDLQKMYGDVQTRQLLGVRDFLASDVWAPPFQCQDIWAPFD